jgi:hypothetical protein
MTLEALTYKIQELIIKRREAHGNYAEQDRINEKLTKLYNLKQLMLEHR